ncbi:hypothetical protein C2845_PM17G12400 [Panicum miliaceum]|uniref:DUF1618 domain-containing protein n=1 Tax=Panicum miliaceum TaxID=4540 RepID=A0A3L6Q4L6_PANMI|nr:hypothetical protein C2845_PM17G12400 [Panicum miliaceum]
METEATTQALPDSAAAAAAAYPRWVLLKHYGEAVDVGSCPAADARTLAASRTSTGHPVAVSLSLAAPPAVSSVRFHFPRGVQGASGYVLAAHDSSLLICAYFEEHRDSRYNYFVYDAGAASAEPPRPLSLSLLPPHWHCLAEQEPESEGPAWHWRELLDTRSTGLLRRGEGEFAVAELVAGYGRAELMLLRGGRWSWSHERPAVVVHRDSQDSDEEPLTLLSSWTTHTVLPVGDAQLCWVDLHRGLLFYSVFDESPAVLRHVPLPPEAAEMEPLHGPGSSRNVCVTSGSSGGTAVKFVGVFPRCCCGGTGSTHCQRSRHAYTVTAWTLRTDTMAWVKDAMVDATELWALDAYEGIPRVPLSRPIWYHERRKDKPDEAGWLILVDTRRPALLSVSCIPDGWWLCGQGDIVPSRVSSYLDPSKPSSSGDSAWSSREGHTDTIPSPVIVAVAEMQTDDAGGSARSSCRSPAEPAMPLSAISAALQEIPCYGMDRDGMLKAYSILSQDNGRRFGSLLGLPKDLRKDWLLMQIKADEA